MVQQTTDVYSSFDSKIVLYVQRATLGLMPQMLPMAFLHAHTGVKFLPPLCEVLFRI